jgi:hypothetical protein
VKASTRFGILVICILLSMAFMFTDVGVTVSHLFKNEGVNPFWKVRRTLERVVRWLTNVQFYILFKCSADVIFLDDFKSVIDRLAMRTLRYTGSGLHNGCGADIWPSTIERQFLVFFSCVCWWQFDSCARRFSGNDITIFTSIGHHIHTFQFYCCIRSKPRIPSNMIIIVHGLKGI